jgi:hypothetical protein
MEFKRSLRSRKGKKRPGLNLQHLQKQTRSIELKHSKMLNTELGIFGMQRELQLKLRGMCKGMADLFCRHLCAECLHHRATRVPCVQDRLGLIIIIISSLFKFSLNPLHFLFISPSLRLHSLFALDPQVLG